MAPKGPIDPLAGPKLALRGRVVTMDSRFRVIDDGAVYVDAGVITAVQKADVKAPIGFEQTKLVDVKGTIFPGLIELHNHLSYNVLPLWHVPKRYENRDTWGGTAAYHQLVMAPMKVIAARPELLSALVRYVECKCLLGGVTTSQGIGLASNAGVRKYYRGIVRNVEQTSDPSLPEAATHILDVQAGELQAFLAALQREKTLILHLSEGTNEAARKHFLALKIAHNGWALDDGLVGIHCVALTVADFAVMRRYKSSMVWSPLSNLLLYGATANVAAAHRAGVPIALGSDWSVSGSKNLLGELKVARVYSQTNGDPFSDRDIVAMATCNAAALLKWDAALGSIAKGKRADFLVIAGTSAEPYGSLIESAETDIHLVMINGVARYGLPDLMKAFQANGETIKVGGQTRKVFLKQATEDATVAGIGLGEAKDRLSRAMRRMPQLARQLDAKRPPPARALRAGPEPVVWKLALDEFGGTGVEVRPRLPIDGQRATGPSLALAARLASKPVADVVKAMTLDPLTVADDSAFISALAAAVNLSDEMKAGLAALY